MQEYKAGKLIDRCVQSVHGASRSRLSVLGSRAIQEHLHPISCSTNMYCKFHLFSTFEESLSLRSHNSSLQDFIRPMKGAAGVDRDSNLFRAQFTECPGMFLMYIARPSKMCSTTIRQGQGTE